MLHPLQERIEKLRCRVRRLVLVYGLCWALGALLTAVLVLGAADYVIRFDDRGIRVLASLTTLGVLLVAAHRYLYLRLTAEPTDVDLALRLQRSFPILGDSLASAVEFLRQSDDDPLAGSVAMRRAVIARATAETEPLDFADAVDRRPAARAVMTVVAIGLVALILTALNPLTSRIALARLLNPFGGAVWPRTTHLALRQRVDRVARGQDFEVEAFDQNGRLPPDVFIHYRFPNDAGVVTHENERMHLLGGAMSARRENVVRPFSYRVTGGDDHSMPWIEVAVVEPPKLQGLTITLVPPAYTGWPTEQTTNPIRALIGTRVRIAARATKPLGRVELCVEDGHRVPGRIEKDGCSFVVPGQFEKGYPVEKSGPYWIELTDTEGLTGGREDRWEMRANPDGAPTLVLQRPGGNVLVTPEAAVPLRIAAKDDLAVQKVMLEFRRSDQAGQPAEVVPLYSGPQQVNPQPVGLAGGAEHGESRVVEYLWQLDGLKLVAGQQVTFQAAASDYRPQIGRSDGRRLVVITPEELLDRIATLQASILSELARVLQMQRQGRQQVRDLEIKLREVGRLEQLDMDHLRGAELNQRQVNNALTSRSEGVPMQILGLLADLDNNKIDNADIRHRMEELLAEIDRLAAGHLPNIGRQLTSAIKAAQVELEQPKAAQPDKASPEGAIAAGALAGVGQHQEAVIASLEQLLGQLSRWEGFRKFHRDLGQLLRDQEELTHRTTELGRRTLAKEIKDLPPREAADLKIGAQQQFELARRLDRILQDMEQAAGSLEQNDLLAAETIADALGRARQLATSGKMRTAAEWVEQNRLGMASERQYRVIEDLKELLDILSNRREQELGRIVEKLRQAERDLADMTGRQEQLRKQLEEAGKQSSAEERRRQFEPLGRQQDALRQEAEQMARRLERVTADQAGLSMRQAAQGMQQASRAAQQADTPQAKQQAETAKKAMDEAGRQLDKRRRDAEAELALEQLSQLDRAVKALQQGQEEILQETRRLDEAREKGPLERDEALAIEELLRQQTALETETQLLADKLTGAAAIHLALVGAAGEMAQAATMLDRRQTAQPVQRAEQHALDRLKMVGEALKPEPPQNAGKQAAQAGQGGQGGQGGDRAKALQALIELKLTKAMQSEINRRTQELEAQFGPADKLPDEVRREYQQLSDEQGNLAATLLKAIQSQDSAKGSPDGSPARVKETVP